MLFIRTMAVNETTFVRTLLALLQIPMAGGTALLWILTGQEKQRRYTHTLMLIDSSAFSQRMASALMSE